MSSNGSGQTHTHYTVRRSRSDRMRSRHCEKLGDDGQRAVQHKQQQLQQVKKKTLKQQK